MLPSLAILIVVVNEKKRLERVPRRRSTCGGEAKPSAPADAGKETREGPTYYTEKFLERRSKTVQMRDDVLHCIG